MRVGVMHAEELPDGAVRLYDEQEQEPFELYCVGDVRKGGDGYWRFYPSSGAVMTCHHLKHIAQLIGERNT